MAKQVKTIYGEALFELAVEEGREDVYLSEVIRLKELLQENPDFERLMRHPRILKEEKADILKETFGGRISRELLGFLQLIVEKDRYGELEGILDWFLYKIKERKGIGVAYVATAIQLREAIKKEIEEKLLATTAFREMEMHYQVDESLIGGMVIRIGDRVVDSSIKNNLFKLRRELLKVQI